MATDTTKVLRRPPVKKRGPIEQIAKDIMGGGAEIIRIGKAAGEELKRRFQKIKAFTK